MGGGVVDDPGWEADYERLTAREKEILVLIAHSKSNREIARELNLSVNTIAVHRNHIMKKIGVRKATALALLRSRSVAFSSEGKPANRARVTLRAPYGPARSSESTRLAPRWQLRSPPHQSRLARG